MKRIIYFCFAIALLAALSSASAGTKEEIERLQADVLALQNQIRELDKNFNEKADGIKSLVVQLNDQVAKSNVVLEKISAALETQNTGARTADETLLQAVQKLSTKLDDSATRISAMAQQLSELRVQQAKGGNPENAPGTNQAPESLYNQAYRDFVQGNLDPAIQGFNAYVDTYPGGDKAASALLNIGEAYLTQNKLPQANSAFTRIINNYSGTDSVATALYKRAQVELAMQETQSALDDLKSIVEKYPSAPEAEIAKAKLKELGVSSTTKPAPRRKTR
jgi:tol-pal system protein YbgF